MREQQPTKYRKIFQYEYKNLDESQTTIYDSQDEFLLANPHPIFMLFAQEGQLDYLQFGCGSETYTVRKKYVVDDS